MPRLEIAVLYDALVSNVVRAEQVLDAGRQHPDRRSVLARPWSGGGHLRISRTGCQQRRSGAGYGYRDLRTALFVVTGASPLFLLQPRPGGRSQWFRQHLSRVGAASSSANSLALQIGGGMDLAIKHRFLLRVFEADWLRTALPNADTNVQNSIRLGAGAVVRFR